MRIRGHVIGAFSITATRRSVILSAEGSDARFTLEATNAAAVSAFATPGRDRCTIVAPVAASPSVLKNDRRSTGDPACSISERTTGFMKSSRSPFPSIPEDACEPQVGCRVHTSAVLARLQASAGGGDGAEVRRGELAIDRRADRFQMRVAGHPHSVHGLIVPRHLEGTGPEEQHLGDRVERNRDAYAGDACEAVHHVDAPRP